MLAEEGLVAVLELRADLADGLLLLLGAHELLDGGELLLERLLHHLLDGLRVEALPLVDRVGVVVGVEPAVLLAGLHPRILVELRLVAELLLQSLAGLLVPADERLRVVHGLVEADEVGHLFGGEVVESLDLGVRLPRLLELGGLLEALGEVAVLALEDVVEQGMQFLGNVGEVLRVRVVGGALALRGLCALGGRAALVTHPSWSPSPLGCRWAAVPPAGPVRARTRPWRPCSGIRGGCCVSRPASRGCRGGPSAWCLPGCSGPPRRA